MKRGPLPALLLVVLLPALASAQTVKIGSKKFTESVLLGELAAQLARSTGVEAHHQPELGGTRVLWSALQQGELDIYAEYTGTVAVELLGGKVDPKDLDAIAAQLNALGLEMTLPFGFNNTYALAVPPKLAEARKLTKISDLRGHPDLKLRFGNEFMDRGDGWPALKARYGLPHTDVRGLDHDLAYRGIATGTVDLMDAYSTDAEIDYYGLVVLEDDLQHFPRYEAFYVYRAELEARAPQVIAALKRLSGRIPAAKMAALNARAKLEKIPAATVASDFLGETLGVDTEAKVESSAGRLLRTTGEHMVLVGVSLGAAILLALPLGIVAARHARLGQVILAVVGVLQTIPSLALLVFMIPLAGIGAVPAMLALFLYSLLPIVRNTHAGLHDIPASLIESAEALGLPPGARLRLVELPLAMRSILAGVKTAAVINIGTATLGALIGAGGYGQPILTGIRLDDIGLILEGAVPAAVMALGAQGLFELAERRLVPKGLRLTAERG